MANPGYLMRSPSNHMFKQLFLQLGTCRYRNLCIAKQCTPAQQYKGSFSIPIFSTRYKSSDVAKDTGGTIWQPTLYGHPSTKTAIFFPGPVKCSSCFWENTVDGAEIRPENQFFDMWKYPPVFIGFYISKNWWTPDFWTFRSMHGPIPVFRCFSHISTTYQNSPKHKILPS